MAKKLFCSPFFTPVIFLATWLPLFFFVFTDCRFQTDDLKEAQLEFALETPTYYLYGLMILTLLFLGKFFYKNHKLQYWVIYLTFSILALLREMGLHKALASVDTTPFKSKFFLKPTNPLDEKIIAGLILIFIFGALIYIIKKYALHLIKSFFKMNPTSWSLATFFTVLLFSQFMDRFRSNYRRHTGETLDTKISTIIIMVEETMELMLPILVMITLIQYYVLQKKKAYE